MTGKNKGRQRLWRCLLFFPFSEWRTKKSPKGSGIAAALWAAIPPAGLGALDSVLHGQPVLNAAQQQGFEVMRQGLAPSANQQAALHSLWGEAPGYVPAQQGGWDEFLSAPAADAADGFRSGPLALDAAQDAAEAAQRQAFLKWTQGEAMTAQEKQLVDDLWNSDPAKASEYWAAGEFLDTEVPTSSALDGGHLDDTIKTESTAPGSEGLPFDNLQDGKGWGELETRVESVTYRRVQGGYGNKASKERIIINPDGTIAIPDKVSDLSISIDGGEHAHYFLEKRRGDAVIVEFEVPKWFDDFLKETAIPQFQYRTNPLNQGGMAPKLTDISTPGNSYELPIPWIEWLEEYAANARSNFS